MNERENRVIRFEQLNLLGKAVYLGGSAVRLTANLIDSAIERTVDLVIETEKAYKQGRDPNVEDAKIIEEREGK